MLGIDVQVVGRHEVESEVVAASAQAVEDNHTNTMFCFGLPYLALGCAIDVVKAYIASSPHYWISMGTSAAIWLGVAFMMRKSIMQTLHQVQARGVDVGIEAAIAAYDELMNRYAAMKNRAS